MQYIKLTKLHIEDSISKYKFSQMDPRNALYWEITCVGSLSFRGIGASTGFNPVDRGTGYANG